ncbi:MAG: hypothetical protein M3P82_03570 [Bacteroidota bacterium]|nr:hypothetical protein [Bacteroidota bacterium]
MSEAIEQQKVTEQAIKYKKDKIIKGITCPSCNGELDVTEGLTSFNCKYCKTLLIVKGESGTLKYYVPKKLKREDAIAKAFKWLDTGMSKAKGLHASAKVADVFLAYIPYWRVKADVVGWIFGQEKRTSTSNGKTTTYYVDTEKKIQNSFDRTYSACDVSELGVKKINLTGDTVLPVDFESLQRDGMMFNIIASEKEAFEFAKDNFAVEARNSVNLHNITFEHFDLVRENIGIVYYPLWVVRYSYANRTYQVVVDGEDGSICYGKAPGNNLYRALVGILSTATGMYLMTLFGVFVLGFTEKFPYIMFFISFIIGIFLIRTGYKKFRYGGEIEEGTGIVEGGDDNKVTPITKSITTTEGFNVAKDVATSVVIGSVLGALLNSRR